MGIVDCSIFLIFFISVITATYRGLVRELLSIVSLIFATLAGLYGCTYLQPFVADWIENEEIAAIVSTFIIAVIILIIMHIINLKICHKLHTTCLSSVDKILGGIFGFLRALIIICVVYFAFSLVLSDKEMGLLTRENISIPYIQNFTESFEKVLPAETQKTLNEFVNKAKAEKIGTKLQEKDHLIKEIEKI